MPRRLNETLREYKRRVIDIKSESWCAAKWYNATIWLGSGQTTSCHHPLPHAIDLEALALNPKALHNTSKKKQERKMMQKGQRPEGCSYCWKIEDSDKDSISDRVFKTQIYDDEDLEHAFNSDPDQDIDLQTLEISFDRTCQFACSYCNPAFSTTWVKDIRNNGPYANLVSDGRNHFTHPHDHSQLYSLGEDNPYVNAFFKWWETDLHRTLKELRITGGEPLMSGETWKLIDWFKTAAPSDMRFAINSNLGAKPDLIDRLITSSHDIPHFHVYTSNESLGSHAEYIRDGLVWSDWIGNVERLVSQGNIEGLHVMCTVNALCLESLTGFLDLMALWKRRWGRDFPSFSLNILRFPSFQSPLILPWEIKRKHVDNLYDWYDRNQNDPVFHAMELSQVTRLIEYLNLVDTPHSDAMSTQILQRDFKNFYQQYDARRGKDFVNTFPDLAPWYDCI